MNSNLHMLFQEEKAIKEVSILKELKYLRKEEHKDLSVFLYLFFSGKESDHQQLYFSMSFIDKFSQDKDHRD